MASGEANAQSPVRGKNRSHIAREAKGLSLELRDMLTKREPWDREVEFQRQNLRKQYLSILFNKESQSAPSATSPTALQRSLSTSGSRPLETLNLLWLDTSHALIQLYRQKITSLDKAIASELTTNKKDKSNRGSSRSLAQGDAAGGAGGQPPGPVARRKLIHSFRAFLNAEETFWKNLLMRIVEVFEVKAAEGSLRALGIRVEPGFWDVSVRSGGVANAGNPATTEVVRQPEELEALSDHQRQILLDQATLLCHKALICFGDLARYRELAGEHFIAGSKSDARGGGKGSSGRGNGRGGGKKQQLQEREKSDGRKERSWARAAECYHQARLLLPENGNPSNQLAVLSAYASDSLSSAYHYYRALCVKQPFTTAKGNLELTYGKALTKWQDEKAKEKVDATEGGEETGNEREAQGPPSGPAELRNEVQAEKFRKEYVALHGVLFLKKHFDLFERQNRSVCELLSAAVSTRSLPTEVIVKVVVTALCAHWVARTYRDSGRDTRGRSSRSDTTGRGTAAPQDPNARLFMEGLVIRHIIGILHVLVKIAHRETKEQQGSSSCRVGVADSEQDGRGLALAQNISAVLRRALPALRISLKWLIGNLEYIRRISNSISKLVSTSSIDPLADIRSDLSSFWALFAEFSNVFSEVFPLDRLPGSDVGLRLEEDVDMLGFLPLKRGKEDHSADASGALDRAQGDESMVHPNEEQLARVADIIGMTDLVAESDASPISKVDGKLVGVEATQVGSRARPDPGHAGPEQPDFAGRALVPAPANWVDPHIIAAPQAYSEDIERRDSIQSEFYHDDPDGLRAHEDTASTDDDPIDLAMRVATGATGGFGDDMIDHEDEKDEEDELILYPHSRSERGSFSSPNDLPAPGPTSALASPSGNVAALPSVGRTASDLLYAVLHGGSGPSVASGGHPVSAIVSSPPSRPTTLPPPPSQSASPPTLARSIWAPIGGEASHSTSSPLAALSTSGGPHHGSGFVPWGSSPSTSVAGGTFPSSPAPGGGTLLPAPSLGPFHHPPSSLSFDAYPQMPNYHTGRPLPPPGSSASWVSHGFGVTPSGGSSDQQEGGPRFGGSSTAYG